MSIYSTNGQMGRAWEGYSGPLCQFNIFPKFLLSSDPLICQTSLPKRMTDENSIYSNPVKIQAERIISVTWRNTGIRHSSLKFILREMISIVKIIVHKQASSIDVRTLPICRPILGKEAKIAQLQGRAAIGVCVCWGGGGLTENGSFVRHHYFRN